MDKNKIVFVAGQIGVDHKTNRTLGSIESQTRQALENIELVLNNTGLTRDNIGRCTIYVTDIKDANKVTNEYHNFFDGHNLPPKTIIGVKDLPSHNDNPILICIESVAIQQ